MEHKSVIGERVFVAFGANLAGPAGMPVDTFQAAARLMGRRGLSIVASSSLYASDPWGGIRQPVFFNGVWELRSLIGPQTLLKTLLDVERQLGRRRRVRWGPRVLDLDLLIFGGIAGNWPATSEVAVDLELPHPRMDQRAFVLLPLAELGPDLQPWGERGPSVAQQAAKLAVSDRLTVRKVS